MSNLPVNKKSFSLTSRVSKSFQIAIHGFQFATSLFMNVGFRLVIGFVSSAVAKIVTNIRLRKVRIAFVSKVTVKPTQLFNLRRVRLTFVSKALLKSVITIYGRVRLLMISSARQKLVTSIVIKKVVLTISPTLAQFFSLGDYDPDTLGSMDTQTLGALDYIAS